MMKNIVDFVGGICIVPDIKKGIFASVENKIHKAENGKKQQKKIVEDFFDFHVE